MYGTEVHLNNLRLRNGRYFVLVLDDAFISGPVFLPQAYRTVVDAAGQDGRPALMAYPGFFSRYVSPQYRIGRIISLTVSTTLHTVSDKRLAFSVADASAFAADAVVVHVSLGVSGEGRMLEQLAQVCREAHAIGLPVLAAMYARDEHGAPNLDAASQAHAARCGAEIGADLLKVPWLGSMKGVERIVNAVEPTPVLLAGGVPTSDDETIQIAKHCISIGSAGLCFGRRILSAGDPVQLMKNLLSIVGDS